MTELAFPANIIEALALKFQTLAGVDFVVRRELNANDPTGTIAVWAMSHEPINADWMIGSPEPFGRYTIGVVTMVKDSNEESGRHDSSLLVKSIRVMLYRDPDLTATLAQLAETSFGVTERVTRSRVLRARFIDGRAGGNFAFCSITQVAVDTEII